MIILNKLFYYYIFMNFQDKFEYWKLSLAVEDNEIQSALENMIKFRKTLE